MSHRPWSSASKRSGGITYLWCEGKTDFLMFMFSYSMVDLESQKNYLEYDNLHWNWALRKWLPLSKWLYRISCGPWFRTSSFWVSMLGLNLVPFWNPTEVRIVENNWFIAVQVLQSRNRLVAYFIFIAFFHYFINDITATLNWSRKITDLSSGDIPDHNRIPK